MAKTSSTDAVVRALRATGLALPGAHTKSPWPGHLDLAVKDKTFAWLPVEGEPFKVSVKLGASHEVAMLIPGAGPTAYGLGKSGWVTLSFSDAAAIPVDLLHDWIRESYRLQAPKSLVAALGQTATTTKKATATKKKTTTMAKTATATPKKKTAMGRTMTSTTKKTAEKTAKKKTAAKKTRATRAGA